MLCRAVLDIAGWVVAETFIGRLRQGVACSRQSTLLRAHDAAGGVVWVTRITVQAEAAGTFDLGLGLRLQLGQCLLPHAPYGRTRD